MREIKFRIWEKQIYRRLSDGGAEILNRYYDFSNKTSDGIRYDYDFSPITGQVICTIDYDEAYSEYEEQPTGASWNATKDVVLEQYTGLKDKNGVEIYEGDIIRVNGSARDVRFAKGSFIANHAEHCSTNLSAWGVRDLEVIGNIYESPGLLKPVENP